MSTKTRINRPTTATPHKNPPGRMIWTATDMQQVKQGNATKTIYGKGQTLRRK